MTGILKPYPTHTDSGIAWVGAIPKHWHVRKLRQVLFRTTERNRPDLPLLSVVREKGVVLRDRTSQDENHNFVPDDLSNYKVVRVGQFVMNKMKAWQGSYGVSRHDGVVSPAYFVFDVAGVHGGFLHAALRSSAYVPSFSQASDGVRIGQWDLAEQRMKEIPFVVPPAAEQAAIVRFLDHADRRIRRYIRAKQRLIKLLEEQKQAIVHRAVTRGLDPNVRLKPSGIAWLGDIPGHWAAARLKVLTTDIVDCLHATPVYSETGRYPAIRTADVRPGELLLQTARRVDEEHFARWTARMAPREGDILYTREGERFGIAATVPRGVDLCISQRMMVFRVGARHNPQFLSWQINCQHVYAQAAADLIGAAAPHVNVSRIRNLWLVVPPRSEQDAIVAVIDEACREPVAAIESTHREISLLREYRTRVIADVVTGKLDVREAAARLPEAEEVEPGDVEAVEADEVEAEDDADVPVLDAGGDEVDA